MIISKEMFVACILAIQRQEEYDHKCIDAFQTILNEEKSANNIIPFPGGLWVLRQRKWNQANCFTFRITAHWRYCNRFLFVRRRF